MTDQYATSDNLDARAAIHSRFTPTGQDFWDLVWHRYSFKSGQSVLDVGCGTGIFWTHPAAKPCALDITLVDSSPGMIDAAGINLHKTSWQPKLQIADAQNLPFTDGSFDTVLAHFMLYHVANKPRALEEFKRVARDWIGIVLVGENNMRRISEAMTSSDGSVTVPPRDGDKFNANVGEKLIKQHFSSVDQYPYELEMRVSDVDMIVDYAKSTQSVRELSDQFWARYRDYVSEEIDSVGYFAVAKSATLFVCRT